MAAAVGFEGINFGYSERARAAEESRLFTANAETGSHTDEARKGVAEVAREFVLAIAGAVEVCAKGIAGRIAKAFTHGDDGAAMEAVNFGDVGANPFELGWVLGNIDDVRSVVRV